MNARTRRFALLTALLLGAAFAVLSADQRSTAAETADDIPVRGCESRVIGLSANWRTSAIVAGPIAWPLLREGYAYGQRFGPDARLKKALAVVERGAVVTVVLPPSERPSVSLSYWRAEQHYAWRFRACRGEEAQFNGAYIVSRPRCVAVDVYVGVEERGPIRRYIPFGTGDAPCPNDRSAPAAQSVPKPCTAEEVRSLVVRFLRAFNRGRLSDLDRLFAREPDFEWYSTAAPGARLRAAAHDRATLIAYFKRRHAKGERLLLRSFGFNGNSRGRGTYGNFEYGLLRRANDLPPTRYYGKGAAYCYRGSEDVIFVWSMAPQ